MSINASANLAYVEQRIYSAATASYSTRGARSLGARTRFIYQLSDLDQLQVSLNAQGQSLVGLGYRQPNSTVNVNLRHALTPMLNLVVNVTDVFYSNKIDTFIETDLLKDANIRRYERGSYMSACHSGWAVLRPPVPGAPRKDSGASSRLPPYGSTRLARAACLRFGCLPWTAPPAPGMTPHSILPLIGST